MSGNTVYIYVRNIVVMQFDVLHVLVVITENLCIDISLEKMVQTIQLLQGVEKSEQVVRRHLSSRSILEKSDQADRNTEK